MKFRGILGGDDCNGDDHIDSVVKLLTAICKIAHNTSLIFVIVCDQITIYSYNISQQLMDQTVTKCVLNKTLFSDYAFSGINQQNNKILFELRSDTLGQVLRSLLGNIKQMKLKLNRLSDGRPVLTIEVEHPCNVIDSSRCVRHDLNVNIIRRQHFYMYDEPPTQTPFYHCSLYLPSFKTLNATLERLNNMSKYLLISAKVVNEKYVLTLGVEADFIVVKTKFSQLEVHSESTNENDVNADDNGVEDSSAKVRIDMTKLSLVFNSLTNIKPEYIRCNLIDSHLANFLFYDNQFNLSVTLPNIEY